MEAYDFEIQHRPGTKHGNADALSRRPCPVKSCACRQRIVGTSDAETGSALAVSTVFSAWPDDRHTSVVAANTNTDTASVETSLFVIVGH